MNKVWFLLGMILVSGLLAFAYWSASETNRTPPSPKTVARSDAVAPSYPHDPVKLQEWLRETHYELIYNDSTRAERWAPLLKKYCRQGCADCCGLYAVALQNLDCWEDAKEAAAACAAPDAPYCLFALARVYSHHQSDDRRALPLYEQACQADLAIACTNAGVSLALGRQMLKNPRRAAAYYRRACDADEPIGCTNLGLMLENGETGSSDPKEAAALYERGCANPLLYTRACVNLGVLLMEGVGVAQDDMRALSLFAESCDREDGRGCHYLALLHASGRGVPPNAEQAAALSAKACRLGYQEDCR